MNSLEINPIKQRIHENGMRLTALRGYFDVAAKQERLEEVLAELQQPEIWQQPERATQLGKERVTLEQVLHPVSQLKRGLQDIESLLELTLESADPMLLTELQQELTNSETQLAKLEFQRMFAKPQDSADCYLDLQAGSGGTEAQDWTEMLLRMYLRWSEAKGFQCEIIDYNPGEVAGVKSATVKVIGAYAYGWLRTEIGVHRLVRKSPFDAGNRRHTSFSAAFVYPEVADDIEITINPADCRIDVYRASGAGGQHVNRTESAVRITHLPTNIVVQCQNDRSQHKNREQCLRQLRAKLYEWEQQKQLAEKQAVEASKADIGWGSQIRSYVLDDARIKDLRTGVETQNTQAVLDGDLDRFIEASLQAGL